MNLSGRYGCALLAGGRGSRMGGVNKAGLEYRGQKFADMIAAELEKSGMPCYLSEAAYEQEIPDGWTLVKDEVTDVSSQIGPMGGIYSCLKQARLDGLDGLFFTPCDAPLYMWKIHETLKSFITDDTNAACWRTQDGRIQTTFGWYSADMIPILEEEIRRGHYKMLKSLEKAKASIIDASVNGIESKAFSNINTLKDYLNLKSASCDSNDGQVLICV